MPKISIHLVTWNGEKYIGECLKSILEQTFKDYFLLIIDNGSSDNTVKIIEQEFLPALGEHARLIKNKENIGFARAHNQAILWTSGDYICVLNQDVILDRHYLSEMVKFMDQEANVASISPKILRLTVDLAGELVSFKKTDIIDSLGLKIHKSHRFTDLAAGEKDTGQYEKVTEIFGPSGTAPVYRRQALEAIKIKEEFFDNDFFSYKEDVDLAYRLQLVGWRSFYLPTALAYHVRSAKTSRGLKFFGQKNLRQHKTSFINYHSYKNHLFLLEKNLSFKLFLRYFPYIFFYELAKFFYILIFEFSTLKSLGIFFRKFGLMRQKRKFILNNNPKGYKRIKRWLN